MYPVRAFLFIQLRDFPFAHHHAAHAGADDDPDTVRLFPLHAEVGVRQRFLGGHKGELGVAVHPLSLIHI